MAVSLVKLSLFSPTSSPRTNREFHRPTRTYLRVLKRDLYNRKTTQTNPNTRTSLWIANLYAHLVTYMLKTKANRYYGQVDLQGFITLFSKQTASNWKRVNNFDTPSRYNQFSIFPVNNRYFKVVGLDVEKPSPPKILIPLPTNRSDGNCNLSIKFRNPHLVDT